MITIQYQWLRVLLLLVVGIATVLIADSAAAKVITNNVATNTHAMLKQMVEDGHLKQSFQKLSKPLQEQVLRDLSQLGVDVLTDETLRISPVGTLYFEDNFGPHPLAQARTSSRALKMTDRMSTHLSRAQVMSLHSKPGSPNVVYLDFDGEILVNTHWNRIHSKARLTVSPFNLGPANELNDQFDSAELAVIAEIWRRVTNYFAPFDVDITTERPPAFGPRVGRILISDLIDKRGTTSSVDDIDIISGAGGRTGGTGSYGTADFGTVKFSMVRSYSLAFHYPLSKAIGYSEASRIARVIAHELGHDLGLFHDGQHANAYNNDHDLLTAYYKGHGLRQIAWSPIMGLSKRNGVNQWSKGEYFDANNQQDDLALMLDKFKTTTSNGLRPDDHGNRIRNATPLVVNSQNNVIATSWLNDEFNPNMNLPNSGVIASESDADWFTFTTQGGLVDLTVLPYQNPEISRDSSARDSRITLDVAAKLYNRNGRLLLRANDQTQTSAVIRRYLPAGRYYISVAGDGNTTPTYAGSDQPSYSNYGSIGYYTIEGTLSSNAPLSVQATVLNDTRHKNGRYQIEYRIQNDGRTAISSIEAQLSSAFNTNNSSAQIVHHSTSVGVFNQQQQTWVINQLMGRHSATLTVTYFMAQDSHVEHAIDLVNGIGSTHDDDYTDVVILKPYSPTSNLHLTLAHSSIEEIIINNNFSLEQVYAASSVRNIHVQFRGSPNLKLLDQEGRYHSGDWYFDALSTPSTNSFLKHFQVQRVSPGEAEYTIEVMSATGHDITSTPGNNIDTEDDQVRVQLPKYVDMELRHQVLSDNRRADGTVQSRIRVIAKNAVANDVTVVTLEHPVGVKEMRFRYLDGRTNTWVEKISTRPRVRSFALLKGRLDSSIHITYLQEPEVPYRAIPLVPRNYFRSFMFSPMNRRYHYAQSVSSRDNASSPFASFTEVAEIVRSTFDDIDSTPNNYILGITNEDDTIIHQHAALAAVIPDVPCLYAPGSRLSVWCNRRPTTQLDFNTTPVPYLPRITISPASFIKR